MDAMWIIGIIGAVCLVALVYAALVLGSRADDQVERYWDAWGYKASGRQEFKLGPEAKVPEWSEHVRPASLSVNVMPPEWDQNNHVHVKPKPRIDIQIPPAELRQDVALHHILVEMELFRHEHPELRGELSLARVEKFARLGLGVEGEDGGRTT